MTPPLPSVPLRCGYHSLTRLVWRLVVVVIAALALLLIVLIAPVSAHEDEELAAWVQDWTQRIMAVDGPTAALVAEWRDMAERHPCQMLGDCPKRARDSGGSVTRRAYNPGVEQWRGLVTTYFGTLANRALCLMGYESGGDPTARNRRSGASGLMQVMPWWAAELGISKADLFDPAINLWAAREIYDRQGWGAWSPYNRGLCH